MKLRKSSMLFIGAAVILLASATVSSLNDPPDQSYADFHEDIYHQTWGENDWNLYAGSKPHIDITGISYMISGSQATVTMTTFGNMAVSTDDDVVYTMHLKSDNLSYYVITYSGGQGSIIGLGDYMGFGEQLDNPLAGNNFTATFEVSNPDADYQIIGFTAEYSDISGISSIEGESWSDYAPEEAAPWFTGYPIPEGGEDEEEEKEEMPGFEVLVVFAAVAVALIILRRKR